DLRGEGPGAEDEPGHQGSRRGRAAAHGPRGVRARPRERYRARARPPAAGDDGVSGRAWRPVRGAAALAVVGLVLAGCAGGDGGGAASEDSGEVTVTNCGAEETFPSPAERMYVTGDGNLLAMALALGAEGQV